MAVNVKVTNFRCKSQILKGLVSVEQADVLYEYLRDGISWEDGVRSKSGFTRKAKPTYDVFDEDRYFEPASQSTVMVHPGCGSESRFARISGRIR